MTLADNGGAPVVAVVGARDGLGKTAIAVNVAATLALDAPSVLIDLDMHFGGVESALGVHPESRIDDAVRRLSSRTASSPETFLTAHPTGVNVLCAPENPIVADQLHTGDVFALVDRLRALGQPVVVDTSGGLNEYSLGSVERASRTILVSGSDVASVRATRRLFDTWTELQIDTSRVMLVLSLVQDPFRHRRLTIPDIEHVIGHPVDCVLPYSDALAASLDLGDPIVSLRGRSRIAKVFAQLTRTATTDSDPVVDHRATKWRTRR